VLRELAARLVVVVLRVQLARLVAVVLRMDMVGAGNVRMVGGFLVVPRRVGLGCRMMVFCGVLMVFGRVPVVFDLFLLGHVFCC
jgi:hypothetical protein